ncbi:uncharacterized protein LOC123319168 [Coccinella septempunctata]|uniref:uncharacterized protein LOC123319168 n=1 Tax=Coccinella septempunctata TaxID=41139 RepID=UPI001D0718EA|nr:uncharacterized protein LOC123319168 [Coccinella septempunctata]
MDFWYYFQLQKEKLKNVPSSKITELIDDEGRIVSDCEFFESFREHLPFTPEEFWQSAVHSIKECRKDENIQINDSMKQYILILISFYTDKNFKLDNSESASLLAGEFYFHLLNLIGSKCFEGYIYQNVLICLSTEFEHNRRNIQCHLVLKAMRQFFKNEILPNTHLQTTLFQLCHMIENKSDKVYSEYSKDDSVDATHEAFYCIKTLSTINWPSKSQFMVNYALLHGMISDHHSEQLKKNFRNLIMDLKSTLRRENFSNFQNVFLYIVVKSKIFDALEANKIMLILGEQFFKETIFKLTTMGVSKNVTNKNNILRLFAVLLEHLPTSYYEQSKLEVFIQTVFNILVMNCINNDEAISLVSKICLVNKPFIKKQFEVLLSSPTEYVYVENSLPTFCMKFNIHWVNRVRNRNIVLIILRILSITYSNNSDKDYAGILAMLANEADPSDMKMSIPILLNLYTKSKSEMSKHVSDKVIEIMYNMAIHNSSGSSDFVKTLFQLAVEPTEEILPFKTEYISSLTTHILNDNKIFITKAYELKLLESNNIKRLINEIIRGDYDCLKLTCAVLEKSQNPQGEQLIYHIMAKSSLLSEAKYTGDLLFIVNCGLKYFITYKRNINLTTTQHTNLKEFKKLLWDRIQKFTLPYNSVGVGFDVLRSLSELLKESLDFQVFFQSVNSELKAALLKLPEECNVVPIMYSVELISDKNYIIPEDTIDVLQTAIEKISEASKSQENSANTKHKVYYYCCLTFMVRMAMSHSKMGNKVMGLLKSSLDSEDWDFKMNVMDLMYDLCTYVVHNFEEFLQYSFQDLKSLNPAVKKQAAVHIEHFVRLDYLKLTIQQYCKFISLLGDPVIEKGLQNLLLNFVLINQTVVEKYFLPLIMHVNFYSVHPVCPMSPQYMQDMNCLISANFNKWKVFSTLFRSLPQRSQFLILTEICNTFFDQFIQGEMKIEDGIWNVLRDAISLFKIMAYSSLDNVKYEVFYDKRISEIKKYLIEKKNLPSDTSSKYPEAKDTVEKITYKLLHLLFYTENEQILKNYKLKLFEAIMFWTYDLLPDIAGICNLRKDNVSEKISNYYMKLVSFYKNHKQCLNIYEYISEYNEANHHSG